MHTILLVDDDALYLRVVSRVLTFAGYTVITQSNGFGLDVAVQQHSPDLMLLDVNMPGMKGTRALSGLRELSERFNTPDIPVILHSGGATAELAELARTHGAAGYLTKPASPDKLVETIATALAQPR